MTAVANPPTFPQISRPAWGTLNGNGSMNSDESRGMFVPRKTLPRSNSSSSIASTASSTTTVASNGAQSNGTSMSTASDLSSWSGGAAVRNRPQQHKVPWQVGKPEGQPDFSRPPAGRPNGMVVPQQSPLQPGVGQPQMSPQGMMRPPGAEPLNPGQPVLYLLSLNGTFERKTISVPFAPDSLRIGRQTNQKTVPTPSNGFFDSKVLSRQHAEIFAERNGKVYIRDVKSSNGTFVNGTRLSQENRESEPHELQTADHLELGIDIVSEDQKTVVHHKVAAKVEHSGFLNTSNNVMDMNFGDLDPANGSMMMPAGAAQMRGRTGSNMSAGNARMLPAGPMNAPNAMQQQPRPFFFTPIATDQILKRLANEMRSAKLQSQDLNRTNAFINTLLSKDDVKDLEKPDGLQPPKPPPMLNGNVMPFRGDAKTRFSEPPAPPPQQPLPEKPDVPSLKRGPTERPKSGPPNSSPIRQENPSQIKDLIEALNTAKRDFDSQSVRMRELENMLQKEREARELAEDVARRLKETASVQTNGTTDVKEIEQDEPMLSAHEASTPDEIAPEAPAADADSASETATNLQARIDTMEDQMQEMRNSLAEWQKRCEVAEAERDDDRKTLAEMVVQLRAEEARRSATNAKSRSRSRKSRGERRPGEVEESLSLARSAITDSEMKNQSDGAASEDAVGENATLLRAETTTAMDTRKPGPLPEHQLQAGLPYASMVGVVIIGMGLMAYINGWQPQPARLDQ